jgi:hypothetical protein
MNLAMSATLRGKREDARDLLAQIVEIDDSLGGTPFRQGILEVAAGIAAVAGDYASAAKLYGAAESLAESSGRRRDAADDAFMRSIVERARGALSPEGCDEAIRSGRGLAPATAMTLAEEISLRR